LRSIQHNNIYIIVADVINHQVVLLNANNKKKFYFVH